MSEQTKHTAWSMVDNGTPDYLDGIRSQYDVRDTDGRPVAYAFREDEARLIAAAPDLLRVAELLVDWLDEEPGAHALCDTARAAIAKAEPQP